MYCSLNDEVLRRNSLVDEENTSPSFHAAGLAQEKARLPYVS